MNENHHPSEESLRRGHEPDGVNARTVVTVGAVISAVVIAAIVFLAWLYQAWEPDVTPDEAVPLAWRSAPPPPVDYEQPAQLRALRIWERRMLTEYTWVDEEEAFARIPVERAMELLVEEGLPDAAPPADVDPVRQDANEQPVDALAPEPPDAVEPGPDEVPQAAPTGEATESEPVPASDENNQQETDDRS